MCLLAYLAQRAEKEGMIGASGSGKKTPRILRFANVQHPGAVLLRETTVILKVSLWKPSPCRDAEL